MAANGLVESSLKAPPRRSLRWWFKVDPGFFFYNMSALERRNTLRSRRWEHCSQSVAHSRTLRVFALEAVDGVRPCHSESRTALYHQISSERESETGWKSPQVNCTILGRDVITCEWDSVTNFPKAVNRSLTDHMLMCSRQPSQI